MNKLLLMTIVAGSAALAGCSDGNDNHGGTKPPVVLPPEPVTCSGSEVNPERLYLQQLGIDRVIIKWREDMEAEAHAQSICFGTDMNALLEESETAATVTATGHREVLLTGLEPDTLYYYSVGAAGSGSPERTFHTAPADGQLPSDGNTRIWIVGDSGTAGEGKEEVPESIHVRDGYLTFVEASGGEPADLFLMLGDNAYFEGTDHQHQKAVFDVYPQILANTPLWPTVGNHEMGRIGVSMDPDPNSYHVLLDEEEHGGADPEPDSPMPYLNIFTLPTDGEAGGLPSGTEQYYSFDYANVHIVSLDSQLSARDESSRGAMLQWLMDDLMSNTADWTIVIFHHPPYTKGSHDSDKLLGGIDQPIFDMREEFTPVFDAYGVDLVYSGHSHIYERSFYIGGHTGLSTTFDAAIHAELNDAGVPANGQGGEAYTQITRDGTDDKVVYTVAGSSGKTTVVSDSFPHPAHFFGELTLGSVVVDITESSMEANFVGVDGNVLDTFTVTR